MCGGQGKHTYTGHLGEGWVCNYREEEKGGGLPFLSLSLKSECSNIEKLVGSQRETADTLRETCGLRLVSH